MIDRWTRPLMMLGAALMLLGGISAVFISGGGSPARAQIEHEGNVIEILPGDLGFNPQVCQVNRNRGTATFYNADSVPRRVVVDKAFNPDPSNPQYEYDTGWIEPGQYWASRLLANANTQFVFRDFDNPQLTGTFIAPLSNTAPDNCKPQPPTPTPTNTPTATNTPTFQQPTPTPTMPPSIHPRCIGSVGCAVAPELARDDE